MKRRSFLRERLISFLSANPTATRKEIKQRLNVSYQAIQKQLLTLRRQGVVLPAFSVNEGHLQSVRTFWVFILTRNPETKSSSKTDEGDYQERLCDAIAESFEDPKLEEKVGGGLIFGGVEIIMGGEYDIILRMYTDNPDAAGRYVTRSLRSRPEIASTSTAWSLVRGAKPLGLKEKETGTIN